MIHRISVLIVSLIAVLALFVPVSLSGGCASQTVIANASQGTSTASSQTAKDFNIVIDGLVANPVALKRESLLSYAAVSEEELLECPGVFEQDNTWTGVPVKTILEQVLIEPQVSKAVFYGSDGYKMWFPLKKDTSGNYEITYNQSSTSQKNNTGSVILAYEMDGKMLTGQDPIRLVVPGAIGAYWVNDLVRIELQ